MALLLGKKSQMLNQFLLEEQMIMSKQLKDGENNDLFDRFQECVVIKADESSNATDSDEESSNGPKVYESVVKGKVKKNIKKIN